MGVVDSYRFAERMHDYTSLFSYASWSKTLQNGTPTDVSAVYQKYDEGLQLGEPLTYMSYLGWVYRCLQKSYRNEYVYKNELVNKYIVRKFGKTSSVAVNEFRVGDSIADLTLFNGESKCFEIKSDLDSPQRLSLQMASYQRVFEKCYILVPIESVNTYHDLVDDAVGILSLRYCRNGQISIQIEREAKRNEFVDVNVLMRSVRANEYRWMVKQAYGTLPDVSDFEMFEACKTKLGELTSDNLHKLFCEAVKTRKTKVRDLVETTPMFRQMTLSMNMSRDNMLKLEKVFNHVIV